jgi:prephenate dehydrogenase
MAISSLIAASKIDDETNGKVFDYAGTGFKDFSRIGASDPTM